VRRFAWMDATFHVRFGSGRFCPMCFYAFTSICIFSAHGSTFYGQAILLKRKQRRLGNIKFIGELFKRKLLTESIMHGCIQKLIQARCAECRPHTQPQIIVVLPFILLTLGVCLPSMQAPTDEDLEALCKLLTGIGQLLDHDKAKGHIDKYFERLQDFRNDQKQPFSSRTRFLIEARNSFRDSPSLRLNPSRHRRMLPSRRFQWS
jgi:hypothetical protein